MPKSSPEEQQSLIQKMLDAGYIPAPEAAKKIGVHVITVYRWLSDGEVHGMKVCGRHFITRESLTAKVGKRAAVVFGVEPLGD